ncbi:MAG: phosphoglycerate kinase, partial [Deltaproteobacteria bacterium]|nr:phosphoglycerate kinase [Deltaproteobacteria bacterium]
RLLTKEIKMAPDCIGPKVSELISNMKIGDVVLLENLRYHRGEQENDAAFAKELAALCDVYINDAFAVSHRVNASVEAIIKYVPISGAGFLLQKELDYFKKAMADPSRPLVAIVGGAKVSSKLGALENMLHHVDKLIIGGAMANTFLASMGFDLGKSKIERELVKSAGAVIKMAKEKGIKLYTPVDAVIAREIDSKASTMIAPVQEIASDWMALDIGPATSMLFSEVLYDAKTIIWNGPMGIFEIDAFSRGTLAMVSHVANSYALSIIGGGDTDVAVHRAGETERISYIS